MRRREIITLVGGAAASWPLVARAQQPDPMRRIGVLWFNGHPQYARAFYDGLRDRGWVNDHTFILNLGMPLGTPSLELLIAAVGRNLL
jgi:putative ABC transport system substrate-binding protein